MSAPRISTHGRGPCLGALLCLLMTALLAFAAQAHAEEPGQETPATGVYTLGIYTDNYPYSFLNEKDELDGFANDLTKALEKTLGLRFKRIQGTTPEINKLLESGQLDLLQTQAYSKERENLYHFSTPYLTLHNTIIHRKGDTRFRKPEDLESLKGLQIMVHRNSLGAAYLKARGLEHLILESPSVEMSLRKLNDGMGDAVIATRLTAISTAVRLGLVNIDRVGVPLPDSEVAYSYAMRRDRQALQNPINEGLAALHRDGEFERIYLKWFGQIDGRGYTKEQIMAAVSIGLGIALLISIWAVLRQRSLKSAIARQARDLRKSEERYRGLFESSLEGLLLLGPSPEFRLHQINRAGRAILDLGDTPPIEVPLARLLPESVATRLSEALQGALQSGQSSLFEIDLPFPEHTRWVHGSLTAINGDHLLELNDITEAHHAREQLQKSEQQLRQTQKLEAIGTLASGIAHDFNNILTAIIGNAELLRLDLPQDEKLTPHLNEVLQSAERARQLVRQILTFSRRTDSKREILCCTPIVAEAINFIHATAPANIEIRHRALPEAPEIEADGTQLHQVIMNLCTNALHAMRDRGGVLEVTEDMVDITPEMVAVHPQLREGRFLRISVRDSGCGMPAHVLQRIFEPFFTTKPPGEGTGLGLSVVHGIVQAHQGALTVYSQPGQGTLFRLHLPLAKSSASTQATENHHELPRGANERVLFVDDEAAIVRIAGSMLHHLNYTPLCFTSPNEAAAAFAENPGSFDLLVTDLSMPAFNGVELVKRCRLLRPDLPVVLASGYLGEDEYAKALEAQIETIVPKPLSLSHLAEAVHSALTKGRADARPPSAPGP